ncbi:MAG: U32 family peptidase [Firmicutes bacterium]|nr:U32 family peptidase [Bacillota bacterium]
MVSETSVLGQDLHRPELVLPAGDLEKLSVALLFGADGVYLGGKEFSLRAFAGNLTLAEITVGLAYAHQMGKKVYITINILAHNRDIEFLPPYLEALQETGVDGFIIADLGVMRMAQTYAPRIPVTISTQANISNYATAALYRDLGASRLVLARELSLEEIVEIKQRVEIELEVFIHGAMCVAYSGRCLLSHYMTGRSANQGACAQPCRYNYYLMEEKRPGQYFPLEEDERGSYIFNSRDLCLLEQLPQLIDAGIDAFKIEGRMKSPLYVATLARIYRQAIDQYTLTHSPYREEDIQAWSAEMQSVATRPFTTGFVAGESQQMQDLDKEAVPGRADFCGMVQAYHPSRGLVEVVQRANFGTGEPLQFLLPDGSIIDIELTILRDEEGNALDRARHPLQKVFIPSAQPIPVYSILRRRATR